MYSSDYKTIYTIAGAWHYDRSANIDYEIEEILPFALASEKLFLEEVHFNMNVKKIDKYAFSGHNIRFDINNGINAKENSFYLLDGSENNDKY